MFSWQEHTIFSSKKHLITHCHTSPLSHQKWQVHELEIPICDELPYISRALLLEQRASTTKCPAIGRLQAMGQNLSEIQSAEMIWACLSAPDWPIHNSNITMIRPPWMSYLQLLIMVKYSDCYLVRNTGQTINSAAQRSDGVSNIRCGLVTYQQRSYMSMWVNYYGMEQEKY